MAHENNGASALGHVAHLAETFFLEVDVADGQNLIDEKNFRLEMGGDGEGQADVHAGGVVLNGGVNEFFELGEGHNLIEFADDFALAHAKDGAGEERVFAPGQLRMEARADFEERADTAINLSPAGRGAGNGGEDF